MCTSAFRKLLTEAVAGFVQLSELQLDLLEQHYNLLLKWNQSLNLIRSKGLAEDVVRHYGESLFVASRLPAGRLTILDIGSGAGFPGLPMAVVRPESSVTLLESHKRKAIFLREASRGMSNVQVLAQRVEDLESTFDWVVCRAVKWEDIRDPALRLAPKAALLMGEGLAGVRLPWGESRVLVIVSRETL